MGNELALASERFSLVPRTLDEAMKYAEMIAGSSVCPEAYKNKPGDIVVAVQMGSEVGLKPIQSLQNIAVIKGKPSVYGDAGLAIVQGSGLLAEFDEDNQTNALKNGRGRCRMKRKGMPNGAEYTFSMEEANKAGIMSNPCWQKNTGDMLVWRARWRCMRALFADVLKGLHSREEVEDLVHVTTTPDGTAVLMPRAKAQTDQPSQPAPASAAPAQPAADPKPLEKIHDAFEVLGIEERSNGSKTWWVVQLRDGTGAHIEATTFSHTLRDTATALAGQSAEVGVEETESKGRRFWKLVSVGPLGNGVPAND